MPHPRRPDFGIDRKRLERLRRLMLDQSGARLRSFNLRHWRRFFTWRRVLRGMIMVCLVGLVSAGLVFGWYFKDLPRPGELRTRSTSESTILYDRNGKQIYDISGDERRILLKSGDIPNVMKHATVAIEDKSFYQHRGLDFRGLIRGAILKPITGRGFQGGSTITQQYIKNAILSPKRTLARKIKEVILAIEIEAIYSKDDILTLYLNEIPYGSSIYGVESASQAFFGKSAKDGLTLAQAATLAALPQAPTRYSPYGNNINLLVARKNLVLEAMVKSGAITQDEADQAKKDPPLEAKDFAQKSQNFPAPHFVMYVREQLVKKYGEDMVQRGGLRVTTTLDLDLQTIADSAIKDQGAKTLPKVHASNAGLVALDPKTGQILAMVGSLDYFNQANEGNFNTTTGQRQPGSAIKPIVYSTLLKENWSPASLLWDLETNFNGYQPNNYDGKFRGPVTMRQALGNSLNIPAVKALAVTGVPKFIKTAGEMGITTLEGKAASGGLALALGAGEVKLIDLTAAYGVIANHGDRAPLTSILKIADSSNKIIDEWKPETKSVLAPEIAYQISDVLSDVDAKRPTFANTLGILTVSGKTVAVKTGTTNNFKDAWTVGFTPSLTAGVWAGNNDGREMDRGGGSTAAAPIWHAFMVKALAKSPNEAFFRPSTITDHTVDQFSGKNPTPASGQLISDVFAPWQIPTQNDDVHRIVNVCKSNGLLATDATPSDEIETRTFTRVHSEKPDNPAWEGPVQAWASGQNLTSEPPTTKCSIVFRDPKIAIAAPDSGATVSGVFTVEADVTWPPNAAGTVRFLVDGAPQSTDAIEPYTATIDAGSLTPGPHELKAVAETTLNTSAAATASITVAGDVTAPGEVTNVTLVVSSAKGAAIATWTNPADSDLASVTVYVSQSPNVKGAKNSVYVATPGVNQSTPLIGLASGVANYVTFVPSDKNGNARATTIQYSVVPL